MTGAEELRGAAAMVNACCESFNDCYSAEELIKLYRAYKRSEWDILPDAWTACELLAAIEGDGKGALYESRHCLCSVCQS